jgi:hypothetical protein
LPGSFTPGLFLVAVVSHAFLYHNWLYCRLALLDFSLIILNKTYYLI